jgi:hypothetical protein
MTEEETALDRAHRAMTTRPEDNAARLAFHQRVADTALVLLLDAAPGADGTLTPTVFDTAAGRFVLGFDDEARLAAFSAGPAEYAALSGRQVVRLLAGSGIGLGLNLGAASETLLPPEALAWLAGMLDAAPVATADAPREIGPPDAAPPALLAALDAKLAGAQGLAQAAWLCRAGPAGPAAGLLLVLVGAAEGAEAALAKAAGEALLFSCADGVALDVAFAAPGEALAERVARVGLRYDLPVPAAVADIARPAPGSDPDRPPRLR